MRDPLDRMKALSFETREKAMANQYQSIWALHAEYDLLLPQYLRQNPEILHNVSMKFWNFTFAQNFWWPKCVNLSIQAERRALVLEIVEEVTRDGFEFGPFEAEYEEYYSLEYDEGVFPILVEGMGLRFR